MIDFDATSDMWEIPATWTWGMLSDMASSERNAIVDGPFGSNLKLSDYIENGTVPVLTTKNLAGDYSGVRYISDGKFQELKRSEVRGGDILVAKIGSCGKAGVYPNHMPSAIIPANLLKITVGNGHEREYVHLYLQSRAFQQFLANIVKHTAQPAFNVTDFKRLPVPIAPTKEQHRIVEEIELQFSRLDAGVAALKRIQAGLKRYRASVLQAACEGRLVPTEAELARAEGRDYEPADELLKRILIERRAKWEADQLAKMHSQGKPPKDDKWKSKYQEPTHPDTSELTNLPEGWCWASMSSITISGPQNGLYLPQSAYGGGTPILRIDDFQNGWSRPTSDLRRVNASEADVKTYGLEENDVVVNRVNSLTHLGKCVRITARNLPALFESNMMRLHLADCLSVAYVQAYLHSESGRTRLIQNAKWAVNQASINQKDVGYTPLPLPPLHEQERIVAELERRLSVIEESVTIIDSNLKRAERLRQAILKRAFEGKLVAQDPNDEPVSALHVHIRSERAVKNRARFTSASNEERGQDTGLAYVTGWTS